MLLSMLEDAKQEYQVQKSLFASCINLAWVKLDEYYSLSDKSPVYIVAVVLDPHLKLQYIEKRWRDHHDRIKLAQEKLRTIFNRYREDSGPSLATTA